VIDSGLGSISFLIAPPRLEANNSARTYRSRPLHPRHIVPSLRSSVHFGRTKVIVDSPNEPRPGGTRIERSRTQKLLGL
jgi:hypothetical protein